MSQQEHETEQTRPPVEKKEVSSGVAEIVIGTLLILLALPFLHLIPAAVVSLIHTPERNSAPANTVLVSGRVYFDATYDFKLSSKYVAEACSAFGRAFGIAPTARSSLTKLVPIHVTRLPNGGFSAEVELDRFKAGGCGWRWHSLSGEIIPPEAENLKVGVFSTTFPDRLKSLAIRCWRDTPAQAHLAAKEPGRGAPQSLLCMESDRFRVPLPDEPVAPSDPLQARLDIRLTEPRERN